jgi:hypothetical protein
VEDKVRPATEADRARIDGQVAVVRNLLRTHYGEIELEQDVGDLFLLQQLLDEGIVGPDQPDQLRCLGIVLGQVLAAQTPLRWVRVERDQEQILAMQVPGTKVLAYPELMIARRVEDGREVDVLALYGAMAEQFERLLDESGSAQGAKWQSAVSNPSRIDLIGTRPDGGLDLLLVCNSPLDDSEPTRNALARKLRNYCLFVMSDEFAQEFETPSEERVRIVLSVTVPPSRPIRALLERVWEEMRPPAQLVISVREHGE